MGLLKKKSETKKVVPVNKRQVPRHIRISAAQTPPKNESDNKDKKKAILASMIFINFGLLGSLTFFALRKLTNLWRKIVNWVKKHVKKRSARSRATSILLQERSAKWFRNCVSTGKRISNGT